MVRECMKESGLPTGDYEGPQPALFFKELPGKIYKRQ